MFYIMLYSSISKNILFSIAFAFLFTAHDARPMDNKKLPMLGAFLGGVALCGIGQYLWKRFIYKMPKNHFHGVYINAPVMRGAKGPFLKVDEAQIVLDATNGIVFFETKNTGELERQNIISKKGNVLRMKQENSKNTPVICFDVKRNWAYIEIEGDRGTKYSTLRTDQLTDL